MDGPLRDGGDGAGSRVCQFGGGDRCLRGDGMAKRSRAKVQRAPAMDGADVYASRVGSGAASDRRRVGGVGTRGDLSVGGVAQLGRAAGSARATSPAACAKRVRACDVTMGHGSETGAGVKW